jgi:hypothetical protein
VLLNAGRGPASSAIQGATRAGRRASQQGAEQASWQSLLSGLRPGRSRRANQGFVLSPHQYAAGAQHAPQLGRRAGRKDAQDGVKRLQTAPLTATSAETMELAMPSSPAGKLPGRSTGTCLRSAAAESATQHSIAALTLQRLRVLGQALYSKHDGGMQRHVAPGFRRAGGRSWRRQRRPPCAAPPPASPPALTRRFRRKLRARARAGAAAGAPGSSPRLRERESEGVCGCGRPAAVSSADIIILCTIKSCNLRGAARC